MRQPTNEFLLGTSSMSLEYRDLFFCLRILIQEKEIYRSIYTYENVILGVDWDLNLGHWWASRNLV
jgi:hypothetical protein